MRVNFMAKDHLIPITNGVGSKELLSGSYDVSANVSGYDNSSINPKILNVLDNENTYNLTIVASGTLTIHVSDDGTSIGVPIIGAKFYRTDNVGNTYGEVVTSDDEGNAVLNNVPFNVTATSPIVYFIQIASDGEHTFSEEVHSAAMNAQTVTIEIKNEDAMIRNFNLTDANYSGMKIEDGSITLMEQ